MIIYFVHGLERFFRYDVIDLDPYGTAVPFLDSAVQAIADGGLLCVTCTDSPVLCGTYPEKCFSLYGSVPLRSKYLHEQALRILLHSIDATANKYKRYIVPWISVSVDFYVRVFVRVFESPAEVKKSCTRRSHAFTRAYTHTCTHIYIYIYVLISILMHILIQTDHIYIKAPNALHFTYNQWQ